MKKKIPNFIILLVIFFHNYSSAVFEMNDKPFVIKANIVDYEGAEQSVLRAEGNVEITHNKQILVADKIIYYIKQNKVYAIGNVILTEPDGMVITATALELNHDLKQGVVEYFETKFPDNSIFRSKKAILVNENTINMNDGFYTSCKICEDNNTNNTQWQIRSKEINIDKTNYRVIHKNAFFDIYGVPVLYTPYFSHSLPNAPRKTGFLHPTFGTDSYLGAFIKAPLYLNLAPNYDFLLTPTSNSKQGTFIRSDFRHLLEEGSYNISHSIATPNNYVNPNTGEKRYLRYHIEGNGNFSTSDSWHTNFKFKQASDKTYLKNYHISEEDYLTSHLQTIYVNHRNYAIINLITFQDLRNNDQTFTSPFALPFIQSHFETDPGLYSDKFTIDTDTLVLQRKIGAKENRLSLTGGWEIPYISDGGHKLKFKTSLRADTYYLEDESNSYSEDFTGNVSRVIPQSELNWSYPLANKVNSYTALIEPISSIIISPNSDYNSKFPNEDSQYSDISDTNIFTSNRFTGLDRVEVGPRLNYGVKTSLYDKYNSSIEALLGQAYRFNTSDNQDLESTGFSQQYSDVVGRLSTQYKNIFYTKYRFQIDKSNFNLKKNEVEVGTKYEPLIFKIQYIGFNDNVVDDYGIKNKKEVVFFLGLERYKDWSGDISIRKNLTKRTNDPSMSSAAGRIISIGGRVVSHGECVDFATRVTKDYTSTAGLKPNVTWWFDVKLKNIS